MLLRSSCQMKRHVSHLFIIGCPLSLMNGVILGANLLHSCEAFVDIVNAAFRVLPLSLDIDTWSLVLDVMSVDWLGKHRSVGRRMGDRRLSSGTSIYFIPDLFIIEVEGLFEAYNSYEVGPCGVVLDGFSTTLEVLEGGGQLIILLFLNVALLGQSF